jgi:hypothetical protein
VALGSIEILAGVFSGFWFLLNQHLSEIGVKSGIVGGHFDRLLEIPDGLFISPFRIADAAHAVECPDVFGVLLVQGPELFLGVHGVIAVEIEESQLFGDFRVFGELVLKTTECLQGLGIAIESLERPF